jgi:UDP-N-acetylmuramoyl-tripeptide--D-alanyl-D-alanine ligase
VQGFFIFQSMPTVIDHLFQLFQEHPVVSTDSRRITPGCLFFALRGERFDGNKFAAQALEDGAVCAVVSDQSLQGERYVVVDDTLRALQALAMQYRKTFDIPVLAITGSNGKTTTKELAGSVLSTKFRTHITTGNFNNHIGVPLTLLRMPRQTDFAVIEMGANHIGEIAVLCSIAMPTHGVITNIGKAHLEGFGDLEGVKRGKSELYTFLADNEGTALVNAYQDFLPELSTRVSRRIFYGLGDRLVYGREKMEFVQTADSTSIGITFEDAAGKVRTVQSNMFGAFNAENLATAIAVGLFFGVPGRDITDRLSAYIPENNRSQRIEMGNLTVILDAYNANPTSMLQALESFAQLPGVKYAVLGDMLELGGYSTEAHAAVIQLVRSCNIEEVYLVGPHFMAASKPGSNRVFSDVDALCQYLGSHPIRSGHLLVKGSRSIQLERLLSVLQ